MIDIRQYGKGVSFIHLQLKHCIENSQILIRSLFYKERIIQSLEIDNSLVLIYPGITLIGN